jgi:aryl-alcohol dehydrogenase-like predicted oxidoreductase
MSRVLNIAAAMNSWTVRDGAPFMPINENQERLLEKRRLGRTELSIAPLVLGGNVFGWTADEKTSFDLLDRFAAAGLNAVDTADSYSRWVPGNQGGESEAIIGKWMKSRGNRDKVIVVTKVGSDMGQGKKDLSAAYIEKAVESSLKRLKTDAIDLYLSHWPDSSTPYEETLGAYQRLIAKGKIRYAGASNLDAGQLAAALKIASQKSLPRYEVLQPEYNLYDRSSFDGALSDLCVTEEIGVITYFSLARGFLSGKYRSKADLGKSPRGEGVRSYLDPRGLRILAALDAVSERHSAKPAEVALAWVTARPGVTAPIASATTLPQVESLTRAASLQLSASDVAELDTASAA